jgi:glucose-6-phosphate isomerase
LKVNYKNIYFDYTHEILDEKTINLFQELVEESKLFDKINDMFSGVNIYLITSFILKLFF